MAEYPEFTECELVDVNQGLDAIVCQTPRELSAWLDREAVDGLLTQFKTLLQAARALNQLPVDGVDLTSLVNVLDQRVFPFLTVMSRQVDRVRGPVAPSHRTMVADYACLLHELAALQLRIVVESRDPSPSRGEIAGPRLRKSAYLSHRLALHLWRLYQAEPPGFWTQLHRALEHAELLGVVSEPPGPDETEPGYEPASVEALVARVAVLASSDVYALRRGEAILLAGWLEALPLRLSDSVDRRGEDHRPLLRVALDTDRPPSLLMGQGDAAPGHRFIDLDPLLAALKFMPPKGQVEESGTAGDLAQRLQRRWVVPPMRQFRREPADVGPLVTVSGLHAIHRTILADYRFRRAVTDVYSDILPGAYFAAETNDPEEIPAVFAVGEGLEDSSVGATLTGEGGAEPREVELLSPKRLERLRAVWDSALRGLDSRDQAAAADRADVLPTVTPGWLKNVGAGGCCLRLQAPDDAVSGGNLIAIRVASKSRILWQVGAIRWLRYDSPDTATIGVQYLTQACVPVDVFCLSSGDGVVTGAQPGLFFRERGRLNAGSLLLAPGAFPAGVRVAFGIGGIKYNVMLDSVHPESHVFSRAEFTLQESAAKWAAARTL